MRGIRETKWVDMSKAFLYLATVLVILGANSLGQIGVVANGSVQLHSSMDSKYRVGDVWEYKSRHGEERSKFTVVKVE